MVFIDNFYSKESELDRIREYKEFFEEEYFEDDDDGLPF